MSLISGRLPDSCRIFPQLSKTDFCEISVQRLRFLIIYDIIVSKIGIFGINIQRTEFFGNSSRFEFFGLSRNPACRHTAIRRPAVPAARRPG